MYHIVYHAAGEDMSWGPSTVPVSSVQRKEKRKMRAGQKFARVVDCGRLGGPQSLNELAGVLYPSGLSSHPSKVLWRRMDWWLMLAKMGVQRKGPKWSEGPVQRVRGQEWVRRPCGGGGCTMALMDERRCESAWWDGNVRLQERARC